MSKNKNLHQAKEAKNDEFFTMISDIEKELKYYKDFFKGKIVYCNCDDARESNFFKYFSINFEPLGLKKLITTGYKKGGHGVLLEYEGDKNGNRKVDDSEITVTELKGDGDFRSEECIKILETCDVVVTNPPFSIWVSYVKQLIDYNKDFLIIGNNNAIGYKEIFSYIQENKIWLGIESNKTMEFRIPNTYKKYDRVDSNGQKFGKVPAISWFTNISHNKRNQPLDLYKNYNPKDYPKYDNYLAFNVDRVDEIPCDEYIEIEIDDADYDRWKAAYSDDVEIIKEGENNKKKIKIHKPVYGVPITFLGKYCPDQFEIIGLDRYVDDNPNYGHRFTIGKKETYARIIIRMI